MSDKIIYIVTSGEYSDYSIDGVFESKELAEQAINQVEYSVRIEEYYLNKLHDEQPVYWCGCYCSYNDHWTIGESVGLPEGMELNVVHSQKYRYAGGNHIDYSVYIKADNRDVAFKIANEKIMMAIAKEHQ